MSATVLIYSDVCGHLLFKALRRYVLFSKSVAFQVGGKKNLPYLVLYCAVLHQQTIMKIGIIGGSYNPPHIAHLIIADRFTEQMGLDKTFFVPAYRSPFKLGDDSIETTTSAQRLDMLRLALRQHPQFDAETFEVDREGVSYTIDTVHYFQAKFPYAELFLLVGGDQAAAFTKWKHWQEILRIVQLCIARRPYTISPEVEWAIAFHLSVADKLPKWIEAPVIALSSTEIRSRIVNGQSIRFLVPEAVEQYIFENGLYKNMPS